MTRPFRSAVSYDFFDDTSSRCNGGDNNMDCLCIVQALWIINCCVGWMPKLVREQV
jgi:hypothetical protein